MFQFIDLCAKYTAVSPYYKATPLTYFFVISFITLFTYTFIIPIIMFIMTKLWLFFGIFFFSLCLFSSYFLAEIVKCNEMYYN